MIMITCSIWSMRRHGTERFLRMLDEVLTVTRYGKLNKGNAREEKSHAVGSVVRFPDQVTSTLISTFLLLRLCSVKAALPDVVHNFWVEEFADGALGGDGLTYS